MPLNPQITQFLASLPPHEPGPVDPVALRSAEESHVPPPAERLPLHAVEDMVARTPAGDVPVRIYTPAEAGEYGLIVYFHGGAFFLGSLDTHDLVARTLAKATGLKVLAVGYRRAPEHAYPAGLTDCYGVVRWAAARGAELRWDGKTLAVAGDSSGGNFVAAVTAMAHDDGFDRITHQVLYYPSVDLDFDESRYASLRENAVGYGVETASMKPFNAFYISSGADPADPLVSPVKRGDLTGLPKALIITAEYDPLRDEGERYGERLKEAGVDVTVRRVAGVNHGFIQHFWWLPEARAAYEETRDFLAGPR